MLTTQCISALPQVLNDYYNFPWGTKENITYHSQQIVWDFEVFTEVKMWTVVFWVVTLCGLVGGY
jgi:hypothetical protein